MSYKFKLFLLLIITGISLIYSYEKKEFILKTFSQYEVPYIEKKMLQVDFWQKRLKYPEKIVMSKDEIIAYNNRVLSKGYLLKPLKYNNRISTTLVSKYLREDLEILKHYIKYDTTGKRRRDPEFSEYMTRLINLQTLNNSSSIKVRFGNMIKSIKLKSFPTDEVFVRRPGDDEFDIMIKSVLPIFSVIAIINESLDKNWYYVENRFSRGWVKKKFIVLNSKEKVAEFSQINQNLSPNERIVIQSFSPIYSWEKNKMFPTELSLPMGTVIKITGLTNKNHLQIVFPQNNLHNKDEKTNYWVDKNSVLNQFLKFNSKNVLTQAFKFLGSKYGWGGGDIATDCSLFLVYLYRSFGLLLPRSSVLQIASLKNIPTNAKNINQQLDFVLPAISFVYISGPNHILLFLGKYKKRNYFIHSTWSFKDISYEYLLSSVVVSDLSLGIKSYYGSLAYKSKKIGSFIDF